MNLISRIRNSNYSLKESIKGKQRWFNNSVEQEYNLPKPLVRDKSVQQWIDQYVFTNRDNSPEV